MNKKKTTIHDIARELNITASTVSRALKDHPRISSSTKRAVLDMAKSMNYQPNNIAAALRRGKSNILGVIIPMADRNFFASVIHGVEKIVNQTGYNVIICQSDDSPEKEISNIKALLELQVDGILASYAKNTVSFDHFADIVKRGIPLIMFDRMHEALESLNVDAVVIDDYLGGFTATDHLIQQGCRNIVHFSGPQHVSIYRERRRGYEEALKRHNMPVNEDNIIMSDLKLKSGMEHAGVLLKRPEIPDGIFSSSDFAALGAMRILKENNIRIPHDIAIVGFSNESFTSFVDPALSTVDQKSELIGQYAARLFLDQVSATGVVNIPTKTVLKPELIIRPSSLKSVLIPQ
jgi:LacI family transcriptional regulator